MIVLITNVTDGPGKKAREVRVYNKRMAPGAQLRVDARFVDEKVRKLEASGFIAIGAVPSWYADYSARRQKRNLSSEQVKQNLQAQKDYAEKRAADKASTAARKAKAPSKPLPVPVASTTPVPIQKLGLADSVDAPTDAISVEKKDKKQRKKR